MHSPAAWCPCWEWVSRWTRWRNCASKCVKLAVAGAFHSSYMQPAAEDLRKTLDTITFKTPVVPVFNNVDAKMETDGDKIKQKLMDQLVKPVLWEHCILGALNEFDLSF